MPSGTTSLDPFGTLPGGPENPFLALMQQAHVAVAQADAATRLTRVNDRMADLFGYAPAEMLGLTVAELTHPDSAATTADVHAELFAGKPSHSYEKYFRRKNGTTFWGSVTVSVIRAADGTLRGFVALLADLTL